MRIGLAGVGRIGAFHAATLRGLLDPAGDSLVVADLDPDRAARVAVELGTDQAPDVESLLDRGLDGLVVATATTAHADLVRASVARGLPTFCEKPVATTLAETVELAGLVGSSGVPVQVGFQRRFDAGYARAARAVASGELGVVHLVRASTHDRTPPPAAYVPTSGGIFRDCNVHDFDALRFVTGREVVSACAVGGAKGAPFFAEAGDVDTAAAVLTLDDGTLALVSSTRYNGGGHDVRLEVHGSDGAICAGLDDSLAFRSAEPGATFPPGPTHDSFMQRFAGAYRDELRAFIDVVMGRRPSPCTVDDALEAFRIAEACEALPHRGAPRAPGGDRHPMTTAPTPPNRPVGLTPGHASDDVVPPLDERVAGAPISWGVCEVPGWGWQYDVETVLREMAESGLVATEFGPEGFLPDEPSAKAEVLASHGLRAVGQFVPVVLHDPSHDPLPDVHWALEGLVAAGASTVVLAAATGADGYDDRPVLDDAGWARLLDNLDRLADVIRGRGLTPTLHPHVGTLVESGADVERVLAGSHVGLCLDTGHLLIGGGDPVALARHHPDRIAHVHLKDVRLDLAEQVRSGALPYTDAVRAGLYVPLGRGDVDVTAIVTALEDAGYAGWYVLEQDTVLDAAPTGEGPRGDVVESLNHLLGIAAQRSGVGI